jgi:phage protein D
VTITATNDVNAGGWVEMFLGDVDKLEIDFEHRVVHISGRDKTAKMTDQKTNEKWQNKQPEDIIEDLAGRSGLSVKFKGKSTDKAGLKYKDDYSRISDHDSHWNVITRLAKQMGCIAFVKGSELYVQPYDASDGGTYQILYTKPTHVSPAAGSFVSLSCGRDLNLSKDVKVNHKSWQHKEGKGIESEYNSKGAGDGKLEFTFKGANLTKQQQDQLTETKLDEIISHERTVKMHTYGDVNLTSLMMLSLSGTGTGFDQDYIISTIEHSWQFGHGYKMHINVRNKDKKRGKGRQSK